MLAVLYDIHGNLPALEACLADCRHEVRGYLLGGDYANFGGWPAETLQRLRELDETAWIRGNGERWMTSPDDAPEPVRPALAACEEAIGAEAVEALAGLPFRHDAGSVLFVHASTHSDVRSFLPDPADDEQELLEGVESEMLVFGHTHLAFARVASGGVRLVNPGSVGMPFDGDPRAAYGLLDEDGSIELRRVEYDHRSAAARITERFGEHDWTRLMRARVEQARFDPH